MSKINEIIEKFDEEDTIQTKDDRKESITIDNEEVYNRQDNNKLNENDSIMEGLNVVNVDDDETAGEVGDVTFMMDEGEPIIEFDEVSLRLGQEEVLKDIDLKIYKGDFVYLVGASGAGKSSIIKMIYRENKNTKGNVYIKNENITNLKSSQLPKLRKKIGVIFQDYKLLKDKTVFQNVAYSLEVTRYPKRKIKDRVEYILDKVGIKDQAYKYPNELSGGQQQRAAIARAIVSDPEILVADEPTGNLDPENALAIMEILERINNEGTTIVMATHDVGIVNNFSKRVILLNRGKIVKEAQGEYIYE